MPLTLELKPFERVFVGRTMLQNGPRRWRFLLEQGDKILRGRDLLSESDADTPSKRLYCLLLTAYFADDPTAAQVELQALWHEIASSEPTGKPLVDEVSDCVLANNYYAALKAAKRLIQHEAQLLGAARRL